MNPVPSDVNVTGRKEAPDCPGSPLMSSDVMMTSDQWPQSLRSPGHHSPSENIPRSRSQSRERLPQTRLAVDEEYFEILKWHNLWCGADTIICHVSGHRTSVGTRVCSVCGHGECLQWSDPSPAPFIQILQTSESHSITQQSQYNSLYLVILFSVRLCVVRFTMLRSAVCHIMPTLYSIHLSWPGPRPTCSRVSITLASLIAPPGSAQPCHPPPPPRWHPENNVQCDHTAEEMTPDRCSIVSPNNRGLFVIYWVKFDIPRKGREQRGERVMRPNMRCLEPGAGPA